MPTLSNHLGEFKLDPDSVLYCISLISTSDDFESLAQGS